MIGMIPAPGGTVSAFPKQVEAQEASEASVAGKQTWCGGGGGMMMRCPLHRPRPAGMVSRRVVIQVLLASHPLCFCLIAFTR